MVASSNLAAVTSDIGSVLSKVFLDIQATSEWRFTLKAHMWHDKSTVQQSTFEQLLDDDSSVVIHIIKNVQTYSIEIYEVANSSPLIMNELLDESRFHLWHPRLYPRFIIEARFWTEKLQPLQMGFHGGAANPLCGHKFLLWKLWLF